MRARSSHEMWRKQLRQKKKKHNNDYEKVSNVSHREAAAKIKTQTHATKCANRISRSKCNVWTWRAKKLANRKSRREDDTVANEDDGRNVDGTHAQSF